MQHIEKDIIINAPVPCVYNQCSQFKGFLRFTPYVITIRRHADNPVRVHIGFREKRAKSPSENLQPWSDSAAAQWSPGCRVYHGNITLEYQDGDKSRVTVELDCAPVSPLGRTEGSWCAMETQVEAILKQFRDFIEPQPVDTEAWTDRIPGEGIPALNSGTQEWTRY